MLRPLIIVPVLLALAGCIPSPLYVDRKSATIGDVPRDGRGEPDWSQLRQAVPDAAATAPAPAPGIPVTAPEPR